MELAKSWVFKEDGATFEKWYDPKTRIVYYHTGAVQTYEVTTNGKLYCRIWGAGGALGHAQGRSCNAGGYGGFTHLEIDVDDNNAVHTGDILHVVVGGGGGMVSYPYGGGGANSRKYQTGGGLSGIFMASGSSWDTHQQSPLSSTSWPSRKYHMLNTCSLPFSGPYNSMERCGPPNPTKASWDWGEESSGSDAHGKLWNSTLGVAGGGAAAADTSTRCVGSNKSRSGSGGGSAGQQCRDYSFGRENFGSPGRQDTGGFGTHSMYGTMWNANYGNYAAGEGGGGGLFGGGGGEYGAAGGSGTITPAGTRTGVCGKTYISRGNRFSGSGCPSNCNDPNGQNFHEGDNVDGYESGFSWGMSNAHGLVIIQNYPFEDNDTYNGEC
jgi:hypothetical protein